MHTQRGYLRVRSEFMRDKRSHHYRYYYMCITTPWPIGPLRPHGFHLLRSVCERRTRFPSLHGRQFTPRSSLWDTHTPRKLSRVDTSSPWCARLRRTTARLVCPTHPQCVRLFCHACGRHACVHVIRRLSVPSLSLSLHLSVFVVVFVVGLPKFIVRGTV